jgi:hypothetical protein
MSITKLSAAVFAAVAFAATVTPAASAAPTAGNVGQFVSTTWTKGGMADFRHANP